MDLTTLKSQLKSGELDNFYIFTGPETTITQKYLQQMAKVFGADIKKLESITDLAPKLYTSPILSVRSIYVLNECKEILSNEDIQSLIEHDREHLKCIVVLTYSAIDRRSKLYKRFQDQIIEVDYMKPAVLIKYIQQEISLSDNHCQKLIEVCERDFSRILLEIDKIQRYCDVKDISPDRAFETLLHEGAIYVPPYDAVFDFVDAVLRNQPIRAFRLLEGCYGFGEATLVLLSNLYNGAKQVLQVQAYTGEKRITDATGLTQFQVNQANGRKHIYSNGDLVYLMKLTRFAERSIKTGEIEDTQAVENVLVNFW